MEAARERMRHPDAMPWWRRVIERHPYRLLWAELDDCRPVISLQKWDEENQRFTYARIFAPERSPEEQWSVGEDWILSSEGRKQLDTAAPARVT